MPYLSLLLIRTLYRIKHNFWDGEFLTINKEERIVLHDCSTPRYEFSTLIFHQCLVPKIELTSPFPLVQLVRFFGRPLPIGIRVFCFRLHCLVKKYALFCKMSLFLLKFIEIKGFYKAFYDLDAMK